MSSEHKKTLNIILWKKSTNNFIKKKLQSRDPLIAVSKLLW